MKLNLKDVTFLIVIRLDSIQRLENVVAITDLLVSYFDTNILVVESDVYCNNFTQRLLDKKVEYHFVEDKDPVFYRTKICNVFAKNVITKYISIWDADVIPDKLSIYESIQCLRSNQFDVAFPYNGYCFDVSPILRKLFLKSRKFSILQKQKKKMSLLYNHSLVGGGFFIDREKYIDAGMENENYYGWGNEDFDRFVRWKTKKYKIKRIDECLFHLSHPRTENTGYRSNLHSKLSAFELFKTNSSL